MYPTLLFSELTLLPWLTAAMLGVFLKSKSAFVPWLSVLSSLALLLIVLLFSFNISDTFTHQLSWFKIGTRDFQAYFLVDASSKAMLCLVALVGAMVQIFSLSYMKADPNKNRFFLFLQLFVGSMIGLLVADQLWMFYGFWELVGASSFLIISFWNHKESAVKAAKKAFILNRIGDLALLIGLFLLAQHYHTDRFSGMEIAKYGAIELGMGMILVLGAAGKSAQFPLMSWLPDAMEGPTPASALIHAATMVTAGVYLAIRIFPMAGEETRLAFGLVGAISFLSAGLYALVQTDIKKTLAYSTVSQIGLMWMGLGSSASLFHLLTHGIFKAGLFLSAGAIIHYVHQQDKQHQLDAQDIRNLGGLGKKIPFVAFSYTLFAIGLIGLPLSNGFFSKEQLAGYLLEQRNDSAYALVYDGLLLALAIGILLSTLYMLRQVWFLFAGESRSGIHLEKASPNLLQYLPLLILAIGSLWFGVNLNPIHLTKNPLQQAIGLQINETPLFWLGLSIALWLSGALIVARTKQILPRERALFLGNFWTNINKTGIGFAEFVQHKIDQKIDGGITWLVRLQVILAHLLSWFDRWIVDGILVKGSIKISYLWGGVLSKWQSGQVQAYWAWITITFGLFLLYYLI